MLELLSRLIFPAECVACHTEGDWLCRDCRQNLRPTPTELCRICAKFGRTGICDQCRQATGLDGIVSLFDYTAPAIQGIIKAAKYATYADALKFFVPTYRTRLLRELPDQAWTFSFVPLSRDRFAERGFNQAELIAKLLAGQEFEIITLFKKVAATPHQALLGGQARRQNLRQAFALKGQSPERLVICDDVITTGTTIGRLARLAKKHGAQEVWALTLAHS